MYIKNLYLNPRFYYCFLAILVLFIISFLYPVLYVGVWVAFFIFLGITLVDYFILFVLTRNGFIATRSLPKRLSNGDGNSIEITLNNQYPFSVHCEIIDEIPHQFQIRDFSIKRTLKPGATDVIVHSLRPTSRGIYHFGKLNTYINSPIQLICRRFIFSENEAVACYPSFMQMKQLELITFSKSKVPLGFKKIRRIGHTLEFEQIKNYVAGDDIRSINWKATAKSNQLMVNQYQDETRQSIYLMIDKGRVMQMPFNSLSLLDYSINASLALANVILRKNDRVSILTYSKKVKSIATLSSEKAHMQKVMEALYNIDTHFVESDYSKLYTSIKHTILHRSLLILFTNFETIEGMHRQLPYLRALSRNHVLLVVFFENTELKKLASKIAVKTEQIFDKVIAEQFIYDKRLIINELQKFGIHAVLTTPEDLSLNTINKYLEIKARGIL